MKKQILLGFEIGTGKPVNIPLTHLIVTGITQESGKTTTLEALIKRSGLKAVVFKTKIGEKGFSEGTLIPPYFKERFDWEYVVDLLESLRKEKMRFERGWIVKICKKSDSLLSLSNNIKLILSSEEKAKELFGRKLSALDQNVFTVLDAYLDKILPELQVSRFSNILELHEGINIIDLERYSEEVASLIIKSVLDTVLKEFKNTVVVIPESWKFIPQKSGNPCKKSVISFIRQGAANGNFVWVDSQDITNTDKAPLKQISTWILGYQSEVNEIKRTLDQISLPKRMKPKPEDISQLPVGHFYVTYKDFTKKVYVQAIWIDKKTAVKVAKGKLDVEKVKRPEKIAPFRIETVTERPEKLPPMIDSERIRSLDQKIIQARTDFFDKISQIQEMVSNLSSEILKIKSLPKQEINPDEVVSLVLQKIPLQQHSMNEEELIQKIVARMPKGIGATVYEVAPLEKIQKDFLQEARDKILNDIGTLSDDEKKALKYIESRGVGIKTRELITKCFHLKDGGSARTKASRIFSVLSNLELIRKDTGGTRFPRLKQRIRELLEVQQATEQEIEQVYNHVVMELL